MVCRSVHIFTASPSRHNPASSWSFRHQTMQQPNLLHPDHEGKTVSLEKLTKNSKRMDKIRSFFAIVGGVVAGTLYLTGVYGLLVYVGMALLINISLYVKMGFDSKLYVSKSFISFLVADLQKNSMSFVLFWTLTYALIYIY